MVCLIHNNNKRGLMKINKTLLALMIGLSCSPSLYAQSNTATASTKATAQLATSCQFTTKSVSFGGLILPITTQQATSNMSVLCNKGASYTVTLGSVSNIYILTNRGYSNAAFDSTTGQQVALPSNWQSTYSITSTIGGGSNGCYSIYGCDIWTTGGFGTMKGGSKGDTVAYKIKHPTDNSKDWNATNGYVGSGTGIMQNIPVVAELVPAKTTAFPAPDTYTDTVTAYLNF